MFNGTAANSIALASLCQSYQAVICSDTAHVETDECGAPEFFSNGSKLLSAPHRHGKLTSAGVLEVITRRTDVHYPRPKVVTLTQSTEMGSVYQKGEISGISRIAQEHGLKVHMDGARFANAVAALKVAPADITWRAGVDVLCFGGTKMGLPIGEAIVFFDRKLGEEFSYRCKQAGQLASKMRYLSAPWLAMLTDGTWLRHACACQRHGTPPLGTHCRHCRCRVAVAHRSEWRVRQSARARDCAPQGTWVGPSTPSSVVAPVLCVHGLLPKRRWIIWRMIWSAFSLHKKSPPFAREAMFVVRRYRISPSASRCRAIWDLYLRRRGAAQCVARIE